jgi:hypothetical protein
LAEIHERACIADILAPAADRHSTFGSAHARVAWRSQENDSSFFCALIDAPQKKSRITRGAIFIDRLTKNE